MIYLVELYNVLTVVTYGSMKMATKVSVKILSERRSDVKIMVEMLNITLNGARKTEIVYKANLNFRQVQKYLDFLIGKGLMELNVSRGKKKSYRTTEKGKAFIKRYRETVELIL